LVFCNAFLEWASHWVNSALKEELFIVCGVSLIFFFWS